MPARFTHKLDAFRSRLGKEPDHAIARDAGVSRSLVSGYRKKHGIAAYTGYKFGQGNRPPATHWAPTASRADRAHARAAVAAAGSAPAFRGRRSALDAFSNQLGSVPDSEIARQAGVTAENVRTYRVRRGIPAAWPAAGRSRATPSPADSAAAPRVVFTVSIEAEGVAYTYALTALSISEGVVVAQDLARRRHPGAVVMGLKHVAELLS